MPLQLPYAGDECVHVFRVRCRSSGRTRSLVRWLRHTRSANDNLMRAVRCNNVERLAGLVRAGADVNQADETGRTALHLAAQQCSSGMVAALLSLGARPDARDIVQCTPLHAAARAGSVAAVRLLLAAGASARAAGPGGLTPAQLADQRVRLLSGLWPPDSRPASASRSIEELREVHQLLEAAPDRADVGGVLRQIETLTIDGGPRLQLDHQLSRMTLTSGGDTANSNFPPPPQPKAADGED